jgi:hypothetical protein
MTRIETDIKPLLNNRINTLLQVLNFGYSETSDRINKKMFTTFIIEKWVKEKIPSSAEHFDVTEIQADKAVWEALREEILDDYKKR